MHRTPNLIAGMVSLACLALSPLALPLCLYRPWRAALLSALRRDVRRLCGV
jgi:hypothetical protein